MPTWSEPLSASLSLKWMLAEPAILQVMRSLADDQLSFTLIYRFVSPILASDSCTHR
jgi:hypothetical protein